MKVKKFFCALRGLISATRLYTLPSAVHIATAHKWFTRPCTLCTPSLQYS